MYGEYFIMKIKIFYDCPSSEGLSGTRRYKELSGKVHLSAALEASSGRRHSSQPGWSGSNLLFIYGLPGFHDSWV